MGCVKTGFLRRCGHSTRSMNLNRRHFLYSAAGTLPLVTALRAEPDELKKEEGAPRKLVRAGQIGTQHGHAAGKMETMRRLTDDFEVMGIAGGDAAELSGKAFAGVPVMNRQEMLANKEVEAVVVETGFADACAAAHASVKAEKHVHLDKPGAVGDQHEAFATMRKEAEARGLVFQMGYMLRYNPAFQLMARAVQEGWLGRITEIDAMMGKKLDEAGRRELKNAGMSGMFELGCHLVDAVCWLMGGRPASVQSFSRPVKDDGFLENQVAVLAYPTAVATLRCNMADPFGNPRRRFMITGTEGSMEVMPLESGKMTVRLTAARGEYKKGEQAVTLAVGGRYDAELKAFAEAVRTKKPLPWDAAHDISVHETALRAAGAWRE